MPATHRQTAPRQEPDAATRPRPQPPRAAPAADGSAPAQTPPPRAGGATRPGDPAPQHTPAEDAAAEGGATHHPGDPGGAESPGPADAGPAAPPAGPGGAGSLGPPGAGGATPPAAPEAGTSTEAGPPAEAKAPPEARAPARAKAPTRAKAKAKAPTGTGTPADAKAPTKAEAPSGAKTRSKAGAPAGAKTPAKAKAPAKGKPPAKAKAKAGKAGGTRAPGDAARTTGGLAPTVGRIPVEDVRPRVADGRRPAKAVTGESFEVTATVFREGHDAVAANVVLTDPDGTPGPWTPMREVAPGTDLWAATVTPDRPGRWSFTVEAWSDPIGTWRHTAGIKVPAGIDTEPVLEEGARLHERAAGDVPPGPARDAVLAAVAALRDEDRPVASRLAAALAPEVTEALDAHPLRELVSPAEPLPLLVERERALYGAWYEFFPRSEGAVVPQDGPPVSGTFRTAAERLPAVAAMGFDVVYLPPIHPIGLNHRKGRNNTLTAHEWDVGVPWAIGSQEGGHDAVHPDLGTLEDFDAFVAKAAEHGLEIALDFALQCSPDHPWVEKHPDWFHHRPDGSIAYAE
ncbi:maltotransferase domain-containing protein, partial [Streptomyces sp. NPDC047130]|uniref:maltotransferase domain-containing protein n=1 Tax=Streptomyces sp. NPDC047130 TaxID=3155261 RepID=UPI0033EF022B